jgi:hypothetical protein
MISQDALKINFDEFDYAYTVSHISNVDCPDYTFTYTLIVSTTPDPYDDVDCY